VGATLARLEEFVVHAVRRVELLVDDGRGHRIPRLVVRLERVHDFGRRLRRFGQESLHALLLLVPPLGMGDEPEGRRDKGGGEQRPANGSAHGLPLAMAGHTGG
jgi:hypothetical protein